nr:transposase, MuDR, MULE transposase domain protein [Tanacetum cinerariifolium]
MHHRNATAKLLGHLPEPKFKDNSRIYKGKDIQHDIYMDLNIDIRSKKAWRSKNVALESLSGCPIASFAQLPYYCDNLESTNDGTVTHIKTDDEDQFKMIFIAFGVAIWSFTYHMRPLIIIDAAHLKGTYLGTNLLAVGMDGNNQIIPIATGVSYGGTGPSWTWFLSKLKKCIREILDLTIICDRHAIILSACKAVFPLAFHRAINELRHHRPDIYEKLVEAGVEKWSRVYCPNDRYNYMRPKSINRIRSQGKELVQVTCGRCGSRGHNIQACRETIPQKKAKTSAKRSSQQAEDNSQQAMSFSFEAINLDDNSQHELFSFEMCGSRGHNIQACRETIPQKKAKTSAKGSSQQAEDNSQQAMSFSFEAINLDDNSQHELFSFEMYGKTPV